MIPTIRRRLFLRGPGPATNTTINVPGFPVYSAYAGTIQQLRQVTGKCLSPYVSGSPIVQVMWKLINNRICTNYSTGRCSAWSDIGPINLPDWARRRFTESVTYLSNNNGVEDFLQDIYWTMRLMRRQAFTDNQWNLFRLAFQQHNVNI